MQPAQTTGSVRVRLRYDDEMEAWLIALLHGGKKCIHVHVHDHSKHRVVKLSCPVERQDHFCETEVSLGLPARSTRNENPRPFSKGSTLASTSSTG
jgi:hypothetical protein